MFRVRIDTSFDHEHTLFCADEFNQLVPHHKGDRNFCCLCRANRKKMRAFITCIGLKPLTARVLRLSPRHQTVQTDAVVRTEMDNYKLSNRHKL